MATNGNDLMARVRAALAQVRNPATGSDMLSGGHVQGLEVNDDGLVRFQFVLRPEDPGSLVRDARAAVEPVEGVTKVKIDVKLPSAPAAASQAGAAGQGGAGQAGGGHGHGGPAHGHAGRTLKPGSVPAPTPDGALIQGIAHVVAVSSGKGGVGKSTVAANLAAALVGMGKKVGLLDADIYGPDIPMMFGEKRKPKVSGEKGSEKIIPLDAHGVKLMSIGFLLDEEQPAIMRGPLVSGILKQFLEQVEWGELDYLIVDMPPGTGDAQLSLVQIVNLDGAVMVTTPQEVSTGDVRRAVRMFERVRTRILGVVENMSGFQCPHCNGEIDVFGHGGGEHLAKDMEIPFLGAIPLDPRVRQAGDAGTPTMIAMAESPAAAAFRAIAERVTESVEGAVTAAH
jgi:ATP-binding protein involved in chromosome partitioning